jgi:hypothetical protein
MSTSSDFAVITSPAEILTEALFTPLCPAATIMSPEAWLELPVEIVTEPLTAVEDAPVATATDPVAPVWAELSTVTSPPGFSTDSEDPPWMATDPPDPADAEPPPISTDDPVDAPPEEPPCSRTLPAELPAESPVETTTSPVVSALSE